MERCLEDRASQTCRSTEYEMSEVCDDRFVGTISLLNVSADIVEIHGALFARREPGMWLVNVIVTRRMV